MIRTMLMYPYKENARFDHEYYRNKHLPFVKGRLGAALKRIAIDKGLVGGAPGTPPPYNVNAHMYFETVEAFEEAFGPHANEIFSDIPNFTDLQPVAMISEVVLEESPAS